MAYESQADEMYFGGAAGGGKTALAVGLSLLQHKRSLILRRQSVNTTEIVDQLKRFAKKGYSWKSLGYGGTMKTVDGRVVEVGGCEHEDDKTKYAGRPHDLIILDESPHFSRSQFRFISAWNRHEDPSQRCRIVLPGNPPTSPEGRWLIEEFAPWLDSEWKGEVAKPGELRWFSVLKDKLTWVDSGKPFDFEGERIVPRSRTFIPSRLTDNPILSSTNYGSTLQALPEPLRSQLLYGDMNAGTEDDAWQVIPTKWIRAAMARWVPHQPDIPQSALGVDVARGGKDKFVISRRHGKWFANFKKYPGSEIGDGPTGAKLVIKEHRDDSNINVDVIGVGSSVYDSLKGNSWLKTVVPINNAESSSLRDKSGMMHFTNVRAASYWQLREALDPDHGDDLMLPPDNEMLADLCAPRYKVLASGIQVEKKEDIIERIGRSPDVGDAVVLANFEPHKKRTNFMRLFSARKQVGMHIVVCSHEQLAQLEMDGAALLVSIQDPLTEPILPPHPFKPLLDSVILSFADLIPSELQERWDEPLEPWNLRPADLVLTPQEAKKLWRMLMKKREQQANLIVIVDEGDRRALSVGLAVCDGLNLQRSSSIHRVGLEDWKAEKGTKPENSHVYECVRNARNLIM